MLGFGNTNDGWNYTGKFLPKPDKYQLIKQWLTANSLVLMKNQTALQTRLKQGLASTASPQILFYALPWLMILLVAGTIAQKDMGIYDAHQTYFSSWILWFGFIPVPGAYLTLTAITICLLSKFLFFSPWRKNNAGIIITHFGILVLMIGGMFTAMTQQESFLIFREGQSAQSISDYHIRDLMIEKNEQPWRAIPFEDIVPGEKLPIEGLPVSIDIMDVCKNCMPSAVEANAQRKGFAQKVELLPRPPEKENEANLSGLTFRVSGANESQDGVYVAIEEIPIHSEIIHEKDTYKFIMGRRQKTLPFSIRLDDFTRDVHPGTDMAQGFSSKIMVEEDGIEWPYLIEMNEPLRYRGYTFYQSSFSIRPDGEYSVLSVVQNKGRIFPYIASAIIFFGLILHLIVRSKGKKA